MVTMVLTLQLGFEGPQSAHINCAMLLHVSGLKQMATNGAGSRQTFKEQEALVYQQLAQLIRDAVWLKSYLAAVMRLEQEAFQHAYAALGPTKGTLPAIPALPPVAEPLVGPPGTPDHGLPITGREPSPQVDLEARQGVLDLFHN